MIITTTRLKSSKETPQHTHSALMIYLNMFESVKASQLVTEMTYDNTNGSAVSVYRLYNASGVLKKLLRKAVGYYSGLHTGQDIVSVYDTSLNEYYTVGNLDTSDIDIGSVLKTYIITMCHYIEYEEIIPFDKEDKYKNAFLDMQCNTTRFIHELNNIPEAVRIGLTSLVCGYHKSEPIHYEVLNALSYSLSSCLKVIFEN